MRRRDPFEPAEPRRSPARAAPFPFVLDELAPLDPYTRPMFGCLAVYVGERIVLILRDKGLADPDSGVWVAFEPSHLDSLLTELPGLAPIEVFGDKVSGWKKLSARSPDFEEAVLHACSLVLKEDPRIGKIPGKKSPRAPSLAPAKKTSAKAPAKKAPAKKAAVKPAAKKAAAKPAAKAPAKKAAAKPAKGAAAKKAPAKPAAKKAPAKRLPACLGPGGRGLGPQETRPRGAAGVARADAHRADLRAHRGGALRGGG